ncbi:class I SAM-dependent methyltransferase [Rhizorhapis suberifaciens]|uniref:SAM-dependent methyltransferase n=1 Tax=Rhizorhapis suberifaciens TaxID=13656 RepID=A0A840HQ70_9SPHN|nr:class I SAM-dependent methyltransferase [Rhizorhapis suberifaciens]MBB4639748.1 SAM-dependent methyltransferase [Rhizorhapis suberifaciens]
MVRKGGQIQFVNVPVETVDAKFQASTQNRSSVTGTIFHFGQFVISSEFQPVNHLKRFLASTDGVVIELGSGSRRLGPEVINVDLFPSPEVDIVADIMRVPLRDACVDYVILDSVIEHVPDPIAVIAEAYRILKPGGKLFVNCPFLLPYHGYPAHYQNFTRDGLSHLLRNFRGVRVRPTFGPMTALINMTAETFAVLIGGERGLGYVTAKGLILLPIFWLKYLDAIFIRMKRSHRISGMLCALAEK